MVSFGAAYVQERAWDKFGRLAMFCGLLDWVGASLGCLVAWFVYFRIVEEIGISAKYAEMAFTFTCVLLWSRVSAPVGIVRVLGRFDTAVYVEAIVPFSRLLAALALWAIGPTVGGFLFAWALIDIVAAAFYWRAARRLAPEAVKWRYLSDWRQTLKENPKIKQFCGVTYVISTLDTAYNQGPLLIVGLLVGTSAAGIYRLADQLAQGVGKLIQLLARAIYPEINTARVSVSSGQFGRWVKRMTGLAAIASVAVFFPLVIAVSFKLASVTYEPVLHATNHARLSLMARLLSLLAVDLHRSVCQCEQHRHCVVGGCWPDAGLCSNGCNGDICAAPIACSVTSDLAGPEQIAVRLIASPSARDGQGKVH